MTVDEVTELTAEVIEAMERLVPQLSRSAPVPTTAELAEIVSSPATVLLAARVEAAATAGPIVGLLTLVLFRIPTGVRAWIEDVVVDERPAAQGVGEALGREAFAGRRRPAPAPSTSRPGRRREAANRLYQPPRLRRRETNVYRYDSGAN